jgi:hypothetical protein
MQPHQEGVVWGCLKNMLFCLYPINILQHKVQK